MTALARALARDMWTAIAGDAATVDDVTFTGSGELPSTFAVTDLGCATIATAALAVAELIGSPGRTLPAVSVDRRLTSLWLSGSLRPIGWKLPEIWDPIAGDYRARDGWILLHTNAPHHRRAVERVLGQPSDKDQVASAVAGWAKRDLETAIVDAGGCAAEMRTAREWADHPQGRAIAGEPLVHMTTTDPSPRTSWMPSAARPLAGMRVLDLTRVLAGPVATRFLAGYGAEVLRIDPPGWDEPALVPEMTLGKRCAGLDLSHPPDRARFEALLAVADILLHGYRPGALDQRGYGVQARRNLRPGLIDVSLCAYGWTGPWAARRGFDSLVQRSTGIADAGMHWRQTETPVPLPAQALDHATGYLLAATAIRAVTRRLAEATGTAARLSLARTAKLLCDVGAGQSATPLAPESAADLSPTIERTDWGGAHRVRPPVEVQDAPMAWTGPARALRTSEASWSGAV
jgi:crotonobetainyl-CoA:carnitine CoA-transferase CaiB-like acyl-CoA transferase